MFALRGAAGAPADATGGPAGSGLLLHAVDERLAAYGVESNTGVKFVVVVDMRGRRIDASVLLSGGKSGGGGGSGAVGAGAGAVGLREAELKPVFKAMQAAYVRLLQNPFFDPDEHSPPEGWGGKRITSRRFADDMKRVGEAWTPGVTSL